MSRDTRTWLAILCTVVVFIIFSIICYYAGCYLEKSHLGGTVKRDDWEIWFKGCMMATGAVTAIITSAWIAIARWGKRITSPYGVGARGVWYGLWGGTILAAAIVPNVYAMIKHYPFFIGVTIVLVVAYALCYYACTLYGTPEKFKYTPLGAESFIAKKSN